MGIPEDLIQKVKSWIHWGGAGKFGDKMPGDSLKMCSDCNTKLTHRSRSYLCQGCGRIFCGICVRSYRGFGVGGEFDGSVVEEGFKDCRFCSNVNIRKCGVKVHPFPGPQEGSGMMDCNVSSYLSDTIPCSGGKSFGAQLSQVSSQRSASRSDDEDASDSGREFFGQSSGCCHDSPDIDTSSVNSRCDPHNYHLVDSSSLDSPSRIIFAPSRGQISVQQQERRSPLLNVIPHGHENTAVLRRPSVGNDNPEHTDDCSGDLSVFQKSLDFENNHLLWSPPLPEDENDDVESNFFKYDDEDDDFGDSELNLPSSSSLLSIFASREKQNESRKESLRTVIQCNFRAVVSQLLQSEGVKGGGKNGEEDWLDIVTALAWQAANYVKPDTSKGGSMDACDYVKVKCVASGVPKDSSLVKGVVCTKNIKHKRMTSQYKNPRVLILGGALEYQRVPNQLASFNTLLQQENDHFKMIISKIEALRPNVLLVERSASSFAQEHLLQTDISLVLNIKRPLLERIARCTGAYITSSVDNIRTTRLGHCELFRLERVSEEHQTINQCKKKLSKTLMYFEGCPRRLGCTVLLRGACREELRKIKHVMRYAVFAAYHLSLQTSFLVDEGATLPNMAVRHSISLKDKTIADNMTSALSTFEPRRPFNDASVQDECSGLFPKSARPNSLLEPSDHDLIGPLTSESANYLIGNERHDAQDRMAFHMGSDPCFSNQTKEPDGQAVFYSGLGYTSLLDSQDPSAQVGRQLCEAHDFPRYGRTGGSEASSEYFSAPETHKSILVSFSSHCILKGTVCEQSRLLRIKFYSCFDKPLGRFLREELFDQVTHCRSCQEPAEGHVLCYTHQQGNLTINVKRLSFPKLPGEQDGKIWMWHRCLRCAHNDGVPPASHRVVMSKEAGGISFGKFLDLSISNHATANRIAACGHSLQKDCLRYYGMGHMVAFFRYSSVATLSIHLPPPMLEFKSRIQQEWLQKETTEVQVQTLYAEISSVLDSMEEKCKSADGAFSYMSKVENHIMELKNQLTNDKNYYNILLQPACMENPLSDQVAIDILELNRLRRSLLIASHSWGCRLYSLDSLFKRTLTEKATLGNGQLTEAISIEEYERLKSFLIGESSGNEVQCDWKEQLKAVPFGMYNSEEFLKMSCYNEKGEMQSNGEVVAYKTPLDSISEAANLSEKIDSAWTGTEKLLLDLKPLQMSQAGDHKAALVSQVTQKEGSSFGRLMTPIRVCSFDSALRVQERMHNGLSRLSHLSTVNSFHASRDYRSMVRDPVSTMSRAYTEALPWEAVKLDLIGNSPPSIIPSASRLVEGARFLISQTGHSDIVVAVYDNELTSIISYALTSKEYEDWVTGKSMTQGGWSANPSNREASAAINISAWQSFGTPDYVHFGRYSSEDASLSIGSLFTDLKKSPHLRISFVDESTATDKVEFSVTCYFAKEFNSLRKKCCPSEVDFVRSLSRCHKWSAQGGKSNVYFAKSLDERFIIKQVTKTELESFEEFAPKYFKYLTESLSSGSPTCLAKVLGIYQVTTKHLKGGKETKMDLMVMENLFFGRSISRIYDLKGSARSRYNPDTKGVNKVLLDMNFLETLRTKPIFLESKAKQRLERAVWNDTSFLASVDVMDYSLLVGVDEEQKELVMGIIDYMRQYTWDKHLETWVKASGILGGPKNESPTVISPDQYKKRFRKAMTTYFLTVPDQWSSSFSSCLL